VLASVNLTMNDETVSAAKIHPRRHDPWRSRHGRAGNHGQARHAGNRRGRGRGGRRRGRALSMNAYKVLTKTVVTRLAAGHQ
jgi:hypothetical protein